MTFDLFLKYSLHFKRGGELCNFKGGANKSSEAVMGGGGGAAPLFEC